MNKVFEFTPLEYDYFDFEGRNYVKMIGRDSAGKRVCVIDSYDANFYLILKNKRSPDSTLERLRKIEVNKGGRNTRVLRTEILKKNFLGKEKTVIRVWITNHKDAHEMISSLGEMDDVESRREWDIGLITKYIKEIGIVPLQNYLVEGETPDNRMKSIGINTLDVEYSVLAKRIKKSENKKIFVPRILAYDIETGGREIGKDEILMISVFGEHTKKVISWKRTGDVADYVEIVEDEATMIERFCEIVREADADILCGYFSDGFDLPYLKARADYHNVILNLGINGRGPTFARGRIPAGKISGLVHVDLYRFVDAVFSQYLQSETLSLNEVAGELVGEKKEEFDFAKLGSMNNEDWQSFFSYNLQDSNVTYKLALKLWPDMIEFCHVVKEPIFDVTRDRMATHVENHILHNLDRFNEIAERRPGHNEINMRKMGGKFEGANVFEPTPGFYEKLAMFDFTSMHASIIVSFNISGQTLRNSDNGNCYTAPEFELDGKSVRIYFDKTPGFFSILLSEVVGMRKKFKKEYKESMESSTRSSDVAMKKARSNAYKLLANATFGYQGFYGARYYSKEAAAATLAFVRKFNADTMKKIEEKGHRIIYGDTDSIAFLMGEKSKEDILSLLYGINKELPGIMELDLEDFYSRGLFVAKRGKTTGAKKKYALLGDDGKIKIRGFETVRRDWCKLSRELQDKVLRSILRDGNEKKALKIVRDVVDKLRARDIELEDLTIQTKIKKPLDEYLSEGPHVAAAKKMVEAGTNVGVGTFVEYFVGEGSSKKIGDRVFLKGERVKYDIEYYLRKQILPAVDGIFNVFDTDIDAVIEGETQKKLF